MRDKKSPFFKKYFYLALMTLDEAFIELTNSKGYKEISKQRNSRGGKYRKYLSRYNKGELKSGAIVEILIENGYEVHAGKAEKKQ